MDTNPSHEAFARVKGLLKTQDYQAAYQCLCSAVSPQDDFTVQSRAAKLYAQIPADALKLQPIKIALLASSTVDHFADIFRFWCARDGFNVDLWRSPYDTVSTTILDRQSELYSFKPDLVWLFTSWRDTHLTALNEDHVQEAVAQSVQQTTALWSVLLSELNCAIWQNNADIPAIDGFGNFAGHAQGSQRNALRRYNLELAAATPTGVSIFDLEHLSSLFGKNRWMDSRYWYHSKHAFSFDACGEVAFQAARLLSALKGRARKALVLDLDNTLWGGVIGDDGLSGIALGTGAAGEAFVAFHRYLLSLKERGIILTVCSKNEEAAAKEPFQKHPDCLIKLDDIAVFRANWKNKADNIRDIAQTLNIGLDAMVFVDDNPVERNLVREYLPMVSVPEMPEDPAGYIDALDCHHYFELLAFSAEDRERAKYYKDNMCRAELKNNFTDTRDYLRSLQMVSAVDDMDMFHLPRMAQLINKSNQFHLTGTRYTEAELQGISQKPHHVIRYYKLRDRFGDNGLIAVLVLKKGSSNNIEIDTWVMSCRVLERTMESFIINDVIAIAREWGCDGIDGLYVPSPKNKLVSLLYQRLGFTQMDDKEGTTMWHMDLGKNSPLLETYVTQDQESPNLAKGKVA